MLLEQLDRAMLDRAMRRNLLCEHRISPDRLRAFENENGAGPLSDIRLVEAALENYQKTQVRPRKGEIPAYARPDNVSNLVSLHRGNSLGTVLDLTRLGPVYAEAYKKFKIPRFEKFEVTDPRDFLQVNQFLSDRLGDSVSAAEREQFLESVFEAMALYRRRTEKQIHPTWAANWDSLKPFLEPRNPTRWLQSVGVPKDRKETWLAVVKYRPKGGRRGVGIYRPTQYDAGWYAHHFPSPPQAFGGGHTMFLCQQDEEDDYSLVTEYIHPQIDFKIDHWRAGGRLTGLVRGPVGGDLDFQRNRHWQLLQSVYGEGVKTWMPDIFAQI